MPIIVVDIESEPTVVTPEEKRRLIEYVYEEDTESQYIFSDTRDDDFSNIIKYKDPTKETKSEPSGSIQSTSSGNNPDQSEGFSKPDAKIKGNRGPEGAPPDVDGSDALTTEKKRGAKTEGNPTSLGTRVINYIENSPDKQAEYLQPNSKYWAYRSVPGGGSGKKENEKSLSVKSVEAFVPYYFNGDWDTLTKGLKIESIWDVLIAMNTPVVGVFNPIVPYVMEENSEQHMMMLRNIENKTYVWNGGVDTAIGIDSGNHSWADRPWWCGIWAAFALKRANLTILSNPIDVNSYNIAVTKKGLVNKTALFNGLIDYTKDDVCPSTGKTKKKIHASWVSSGGSMYDGVGYNDGVAAVFVRGLHFDSSGLKKSGQDLLKKVANLDWGMATISRGMCTHIEILAGINLKNNTLLTIGGNTGATGLSNGKGVAIQNRSLPSFGGDYIVLTKVDGDGKRKKNTLQDKFVITETMQKYFDSIGNTPNISPDLKNLLKNYI